MTHVLANLLAALPNHHPFHRKPFPRSDLHKINPNWQLYTCLEILQIIRITKILNSPPHVVKQSNFFHFGAGIFQLNGEATIIGIGYNPNGCV